MAELKKVLEDRIMAHEDIGSVILGGEEPLNAIKLKVKKTETGERYDTHECIMTIKSKRNIFQLVTERQLVKLMRSLEEPWGMHEDDPYPHVLKVLNSTGEATPDKKQINITFRIISTIER